ncbi:hypothetical protein BDV18DRAFT_2625 [Aspergillus unguis]
MASILLSLLSLDIFLSLHPYLYPYPYHGVRPHEDYSNYFVSSRSPTITTLLYLCPQSPRQPHLNLPHSLQPWSATSPSP